MATCGGVEFEAFEHWSWREAANRRLAISCGHGYVQDEFAMKEEEESVDRKIHALNVHTQHALYVQTSWICYAVCIWLRLHAVNRNILDKEQQTVPVSAVDINGRHLRKCVRLRTKLVNLVYCCQYGRPTLFAVCLRHLFFYRASGQHA